MPFTETYERSRISRLPCGASVRDGEGVLSLRLWQATVIRKRPGAIVCDFRAGGRSAASALQRIAWGTRSASFLRRGDIFPKPIFARQHMQLRTVTLCFRESFFWQRHSTERCGFREPHGMFGHFRVPRPCGKGGQGRNRGYDRDSEKEERRTHGSGARCGGIHIIFPEQRQQGIARDDAPQIARPRRLAKRRESVCRRGLAPARSSTGRRRNADRR